MHSSAEMGRWWRAGAALDRRAGLLEAPALAVAALTLYLFELGKGALPDWDSAIYAEVSKEMLRGHHWLTPYWNHRPFFEKPPLLYWAQMVDFRLFGVNEFAARLPSALAGVGIVLLVYATTRRMAGRLAGLFAGLVLLTTHGFDHSMRLGTTDALLCLCIYLMVYGYVRLREGDGRWFVLVCAGLGLGILAKGPAALVGPMAIGLDWVFQGRRKLVAAKQLWLGVAVLLAVALPWHVWMVAHYGREFLNNYAGYQVFDRATGALEGNSHPWWYYLRVIGRGAFPWWLLGVVAGVKLIWRREWKHLLPWLLMGVTLGLYSAVQTKLYWYVLPLYPALAMEVGQLLAEGSRKWRWAAPGALVVIAIGLGVGFWKLASWPGDAVANQERRLALEAKARADAGPLMVVGMAGPEPTLDIRTVLFYSGRHVVWQQLPDELGKLEAAMKAQGQVDVVMLRSTAAKLRTEFAVRKVAESGETELAQVRRKG